MNYTKQDLKDLVYKVNGAAIEVHKHLGPGLLESVYHKCLIRELELKEIKFQTELSIPIEYKGIEVNAELRCDLIIENKLVVELKSVTEMKPIF
jgi:GxxExxY protein